MTLSLVGSVCWALGWESQGFWFITLADQKMKKHQGKVPGHFWSTAEVPLSKLLNPECLACLSKATYLFCHLSLSHCMCFFVVVFLFPMCVLKQVQKQYSPPWD